MLTVPPITPAIMIRKRRLQPLERQIRTTHNRLAHIIKAMNHMPVMILRQLNRTLQAAVHFDHRVQTVQLVRHGCREDSFVLVPDDGRRQVVVVLRALDVLEAHADGN